MVQTKQVNSRRNVTKVEIAHLEKFLDLEKNVHEGTFYILKYS